MLLNQLSRALYEIRSTQKTNNLDERIIQEGETHAICLRSVSRQLKRVAAE